ncbi:MAG TPA: NtaA/DmoA family FMN-dependent monooxygenase [Mesorhizobium sp.]|jgi:FMN-dependent oxidoreductase (nitrilotriacetate monooxygenase family)|uniref:NtaA/DmoA family FMN-dependent monooxygenase n=1 Tax=Mesorhizobium sp. TaxID=1871066 RepID=UPI002DDC9B9A|nr:NtaA/DmoA family FMN-dependent monooxygenase [Mesorhizobium sp.]HEV2505055.1 NtaA/DmoA family FMN-dependent monooxygenase [Mesorhizobium sp.]
MSTDRKLHIGLSLTPTWLKGQRPHPDEALSAGMGPVEYYVELARLAERAKLDFVFRPDYLVMNQAMVAHSSTHVGLDPTMMLAAIARETEKIGLVTTASTTFNQPYIVARQIQSLHWISNGRAGWNIVTSIEGAENFGTEPMPSPEVRYRKAAEFTDVVRQLWQSYPGVSSAVRSLDHAGEFFGVKGPLNVPGHEAGPPPLFQAGASEIGRSFAASVADATFAAMPDMSDGIELRTDLRNRAVQQGRSANAVRVLPGLYFFLARTRDEAWKLHERAHAHLTRERRVEALKSVLGLDVGALAPGSRVTADLLPASDHPVRSRTHAELLRRFIAANSPTVEEVLARPEVVGSAHWVSVGTLDDVLNDIVQRFEAGALDGFIALPGGSVGSLNLFFEELVPELVRRGLFRGDYEGSTLREHLGIH